MKKLLILALSLAFTVTAFGEIRGPRRIHCEIRYGKATIPIDQVMKKTEGECQDYGCDKESRLLKYSDFSQLENKVIDCTDDVCVATFGEIGSLIYMRYHYNSQGGALEITDNSTEISTYSRWLNQNDLTKTGHLSTRTEIKLFKGGLLKDEKIWSVEAGCYAKISDL